MKAREPMICKVRVFIAHTYYYACDYDERAGAFL